MSTRQSTPFPNLKLLSGAQGDVIRVQGTRVTLVSCDQATIECSIDAGAFARIAPGFPINTGTEIFNSVQFRNSNGSTANFEAEIGWTERPDNRTNVSSGSTLPVHEVSTLNIQGFVSLQTTAVVDQVKSATLTTTKYTVNNASSQDIAADATRRGLIIYNDGAGTVWFRDQVAATDLGTPILSKEKFSLGDYTGAFRIRNDSGAACDIHVNAFTN